MVKEGVIIRWRPDIIAIGVVVVLGIAQNFHEQLVINRLSKDVEAIYVARVESWVVDGIEPALLQELAADTLENTPYPRMLSGRIEGRLLKMLVQISGARRVLEVGMFTGYSALSMAEALPADGEVHTLEQDEVVATMARKYFARSPHGHKVHIHMGEALGTIAQLTDTFDFVFIDADKENYTAYYAAIYPKLAPGGLMVVDNALWDGAVLNPKEETDVQINNLNRIIADDPTMENVLIPVRDGIHIARKRND